MAHSGTAQTSAEKRTRSVSAEQRTLREYFSYEKKPKLSCDRGEASESPAEPLKDHHTPFVQYHKPDLGLNVDYYHQVYSDRGTADKYFHLLKSQLADYLDKSDNSLRVFGKTHTIPRKQAAFGDSGLTYSFSGVTVQANAWLPLLLELKTTVEKLVKESFNFVLINWYKDGADHIGEHRDDERDLVFGAPIAGLSFGQSRDFIFKHKDSRGKDAKRKDISPVKIHLGHGSLVVMKYPTNVNWYHSIPPRKRAFGVRISLTFRRMKTQTT